VLRPAAGHRARCKWRQLLLRLAANHQIFGSIHVVDVQSRQASPKARLFQHKVFCFYQNTSIFVLVVAGCELVGTFGIESCELLDTAIVFVADPKLAQGLIWLVDVPTEVEFHFSLLHRQDHTFSLLFKQLLLFVPLTGAFLAAALRRSFFLSRQMRSPVWVLVFEDGISWGAIALAVPTSAAVFAL